MGEKASVTLLFVALGLLEPISPAWAKKDKVDVTLTEPVSGALYHAPAAIVLSAMARAQQNSHPIVKVEFFQGTSLVGSVTGPRPGDQYTLSWTGVAAGTYSLATASAAASIPIRARGQRIITSTGRRTGAARSCRCSSSCRPGPG